MKYQTAVNDLEFYAYHGLYEEEKVLGGLFLVDVLLETDTQVQITHIGQALNYELIFLIAKEEMEARKDLIETVAQQMLMRLSDAFGDETSVRVSIRKKNPGGLFGSGSAAVIFTT